MSGPGGKSGDLYDHDMGDDVTGGNWQPDWDPLRHLDHHNVHGPGGHFSWDTDADDEANGVHGTLHDPGGNLPW